jgi:hypothetical protein
MTFEINQLGDPFAKLPMLAERLGVAPTSESDGPSVYFVVRDGRRYSLFDLANAFLDRMDRTSQLFETKPTKGAAKAGEE